MDESPECQPVSSHQILCLMSDDQLHFAVVHLAQHRPEQLVAFLKKLVGEGTYPHLCRAILMEHNK